jgi:hypothetical protein
MHEQKHPKIYIAFLILSLLLAILLFLTSATVYAVSSDYPKEEQTEKAENCVQNQVNSSSSDMNSLKKSAEKQIQNAQSEQEVREAYQTFKSQAKQVKAKPAKQKISVQKQQKTAPAATYSEKNVYRPVSNGSVSLKSTIKKPQKTTRRNKTKKKASDKKTITRKQKLEKKHVKETSKSHVQKKTNRPKTAEDRNENNPFPALFMLSLFLSYAMIRLSVFGGNNGIEITFIELHRKEGGV